MTGCLEIKNDTNRVLVLHGKGVSPTALPPGATMSLTSREVLKQAPRIVHTFLLMAPENGACEGSSDRPAPEGDGPQKKRTQHSLNRKSSDPMKVEGTLEGLLLIAGRLLGKDGKKCH